MAHGKTLHMRNIRRPGPQPVHTHTGAPRWVRRTPRLFAAWIAQTKRLGNPNGQYINPDRDLRPGRRLRADLQSS